MRSAGKLGWVGGLSWCVGRGADLLLLSGTWIYHSQWVAVSWASRLRGLWVRSLRLGRSLGWARGVQNCRGDWVHDRLDIYEYIEAEERMEED